MSIERKFSKLGVVTVASFMCVNVLTSMSSNMVQAVTVDDAQKMNAASQDNATLKNMKTRGGTHAYTPKNGVQQGIFNDETLAPGKNEAGKSIGEIAKDLDQHNDLGIASEFGIFSKKTEMNADTNSNVATDNLNDQVDFGARGESHNHTDGDISYIGKIEKLHDDTFRTGKNHVVLGKGNKVSVNKDGHVEINDNSKQVNLKPEDVTIEKDDQKYIDIDAELDKLSKRSVEWNKKSDTKGIIKDLSDWNNQIIDISGAKIDKNDKANNIYVNLDSKILNGAQPITITGLKDGENSPTVIVNVVYQDADKHELNVQAQIKLRYITDTNQFEEENAGSEGHKHENHVIWNFGNDLKKLSFTSGFFMGSVLAPKATISCGVNVNGNIIGNTVIIGNENHRWDLHNNGEHHFPFEHNDIDFVFPDPSNPNKGDDTSNKPDDHKGDDDTSNKPDDHKVDDDTPDNPNDHKKPHFPYNNYYQEPSQKMLDRQPNSQAPVTSSSLDKLENKEEYPSVVPITFYSSSQKKQTHYSFYAPMAKENKYVNYKKFINIKNQNDTVKKLDTKVMLPKTGKKSTIFTTLTGIMVSIVAVIFLFKEDLFKKNRK